MPGKMSNGKPKPGNKGDKPFMSTKDYEKHLAKIMQSGASGKGKGNGKGKGKGRGR